MLTQEEIQQGFIEQCESIRRGAGLTQAQMARVLDLSPAQYKVLVAGGTAKIGVYTVYRLAEYVNKSMHMVCGIDTPVSAIEASLSRCTPVQQQFVADIAALEASLRAGQRVTGILKRPVIVPTGNVEDGMLWNSCTIEFADVSGAQALTSDTISCGIKVTSNHLHPAYVRGDIVLICRRPPRDGDLAVVINKDNGRAYARHFKQGDPCRLESINGYGETFTVDPDNPADMGRWIKFGVVVTKLR